MLDVLLDGLKEIQNTGLEIVVDLDGEGPRLMTFKVPIAFVMGDMKGNDMLAGKFGSHSTKVQIGRAHV